MKVCIRVDSSVEIGTGHVMRCLTLAEALRVDGSDVMFVSMNSPGDMCTLIRSRGFEVYELPNVGDEFEAHTDAERTRSVLESTPMALDWLVVDHYALDKTWERSLRACAGRIMVIDDLADRTHDCDLLLDQNFYANSAERYQGMLPRGCRTLFGPQYALLRAEFLEAGRRPGRRDGTVERMLIFFGGADNSNETCKALLAIGEPRVPLDVVVGRSNPHKDSVERRCLRLPKTRFFCQVDNMAELMCDADLAVGAGGATHWERCFLGLPAIVLETAKNQHETTVELANAGAVWNLGWYEHVSPGNLAAAIDHALASPGELVVMSERAGKIIGSDRDLGTKAVVSEMRDVRALLTERAYE